MSLLLLPPWSATVRKHLDSAGEHSVCAGKPPRYVTSNSNGYFTFCENSLGNKSFPNKCFKAHQMIGGAALFTEATLNRREQFIFLQVPDQSVVDHTFHDLVTISKYTRTARKWTTLPNGNRHNEYLSFPLTAPRIRLVTVPLSMYCVYLHRVTDW